jgi:hypothetical protein
MCLALLNQGTRSFETLVIRSYFHKALGWDQSRMALPVLIPTYRGWKSVCRAQKRLALRIHDWGILLFELAGINRLGRSGYNPSGGSGLSESLLRALGTVLAVVTERPLWISKSGPLPLMIGSRSPLGQAFSPRMTEKEVR